MANQEFNRQELDADDLGLNDVDYFRDFIRNPSKGGITVNFSSKDKNFAKNSSPPAASFATSHTNLVPASGPERENSNGGSTGWSTAGFSSLQSPKPPSRANNTGMQDFDALRRPFRQDIREKANYDKSYNDRVTESDREYRKGVSRRRDSREYGKDRRRMRSRSRSKSRSRSRSRDRYDSRRHTRSPHRMERKPYSPPHGNPYAKMGMMSGSDHRGPPDYFPDANMGYYNGPPPTNPYQPPPGWGNTAPSWTPNVVEIQQVETAEDIARKKAVEKEASNLINDFLAQKKNYLKKRKIFSKELELLKQQRRELLMNNDSMEMKKVMAENIRLQEELVGKIKYVDNGLEMLQGLISSHLPKGAILEEPKKSKKKQSDSSSDDSDSDSSDSEEDQKIVKKKNVVDDKKLFEAYSWPKKGDGDGLGRGKSEGHMFNLSFYDTEIHWCRPCKAFPPTAKDYLNHLHSKEHKETNEERTIEELPWHDKKEHEEPVIVPGVETKRTAIKGLQFFVGSTAWYCRLCQSWMGDFHCASLHLKSKLHNDNYAKFIEKNPKWEVSWLSERGKAVIACGKKEDVLKRQLEEQLLLQKKHEDEIRQSMEASSLVMPLTLQTQPKNVKSKKSKKGKKKKKRKVSNSSSSSSSSSSSDSSSEEDNRKKRKSKKKKRDKSRGRSSAMVGSQKSKWEKDENEFDFESKRSPEPNHPILEARQIAKKVRSYKWTDDLLASQAPTSPHIPEKHTILIPESNASSKISSSGSKTQDSRKDDDMDDGESRFDMRAAAAVGKKKPLPPNVKTKFAFIGRMPFAKKRNDPSDTTKAKKEQDVATPDPTPPPPPVISKTVIPPKVQQPEPPVLTSKTKVEVAKEILTKSQMGLVERQQTYEMRPIDPVSMEMDMDIEKPLSPPLPMQFTPPLPKYMPALPPEVTGNLGKRTMAVPLPKDFQDALSIIYPENAPPKVATPPPPPPPSMDRPQPPREDSPPLPPPAPPITLPVNDPESDGEGFPQPPSPPSPREYSYDRTPPSPPEHFFSNMDDIDDMAMLGIDKEDMAAQPF